MTFCRLPPGTLELIWQTRQVSFHSSCHLVSQRIGCQASPHGLSVTCVVINLENVKDKQEERNLDKKRLLPRKLS
jgi:hypothetical protein